MAFQLVTLLSISVTVPHLALSGLQAHARDGDRTASSNSGGADSRHTSAQQLGGAQLQRAAAPRSTAAALTTTSLLTHCLLPELFPCELVASSS
jgi:hypothetical protein